MCSKIGKTCFKGYHVVTQQHCLGHVFYSIILYQKSPKNCQKMPIDQYLLHWMDPINSLLPIHFGHDPVPLLIIRK